MKLFSKNLSNISKPLLIIVISCLALMGTQISFAQPSMLYTTTGSVYDDKSSDDKSSDDNSSDDNSSDDNSSDDINSDDKSSDDKSSDDINSDDKSSDDKSSDDINSDDKSSDDKSSDDINSDDKSSDDINSDDKSSDDINSDDKSSDDDSSSKECIPGDDGSSDDSSSANGSSDDSSSDDGSSKDCGCEPGITASITRLITDAEPIMGAGEKENYVFEVTLNQASTVCDITMQYASVDGGNALKPANSIASQNGTTGFADYDAVSGQLLFTVNELSKTITVPVIQDNILEFVDEAFSVNLSNAVNAKITNASGVGVITREDP